MKLVPEDLRGTCEGTDLTDAEVEIDCSNGRIDLYLARWPSAKAARAALRSEVEDAECDLLDRADGAIVAGKTEVGRGYGCDDGEMSFQFTNEPDGIQVSVDMPGATLVEIQQWVREQRPGFAGRPKLGGAGLGPPVGAQSLKALIPRAKAVPYRTLARHIEDYLDTLLHYRAKVLQVTDDGALVLVTNDGGAWRDIVFIDYSMFDRLLDDDLIEFVGRGGGNYDYVTVAGDERAVPRIDVIEMRVH